MSIDKKKIILVEGRDDENFIYSLLNSKSIDDILVEPYNGKDRLTSHINSLTKREGFDETTSILILRDSDESLESASDSINYSLRTTRLIDKNLSPFKIDFQNNRKIGFGLFPGVGENGTLEDLCLRIFKENANNELIDSYLDDFQNKKGSFKHIHKNKLHTLFSFTDKYVGYKIGETANFGGFDFDSHHLEPFLKLINEM